LYQDNTKIKLYNGDYYEGLILVAKGIKVVETKKQQNKIHTLILFSFPSKHAL